MNRPHEYFLPRNPFKVKFYWKRLAYRSADISLPFQNRLSGRPLIVATFLIGLPFSIRLENSRKSRSRALGINHLIAKLTHIKIF